MSLLKAIKAQLGLSNTATNNFTLTAEAADGTMKLARGNAGATTQDILTVDASGNVNAPVAMQQGGVAMPRMVLATAQNTTSGTSIDFTSIPSWVKRITVMFNGVSTSGVSPKQVQLGTSGGFLTSGYLGSASGISTGVSTINASSGLLVENATSNAEATHGTITITNFSGNLWVSSSVRGQSGVAACAVAGCSATLSGPLDRLRLTTVNGTDTFDAGSVNILYEG